MSKKDVSKKPVSDESTPTSSTPTSSSPSSSSTPTSTSTATRPSSPPVTDVPSSDLDSQLSRYSGRSRGTPLPQPKPSIGFEDSMFGRASAVGSSLPTFRNAAEYFEQSGAGGIAKAQPGADAPASSPDQVAADDEGGDIASPGPSIRIVTSPSQGGAAHPLESSSDGMPDPNKL